MFFTYIFLIWCKGKKKVLKYLNILLKLYYLNIYIFFIFFLFQPLLEILKQSEKID